LSSDPSVLALRTDPPRARGDCRHRRGARGDRESSAESHRRRSDVRGARRSHERGDAPRGGIRISLRPGVPRMAVKHQEIAQHYALYCGDCCEVMPTLPDGSVHLSLYSPPFGGLYHYSSSARDLSNSRDYREFFEHYG